MTEELNNAYEKIVDPLNFVKNFDTDDDFMNWLRRGTENDLKGTYKTFYDERLYRYCELIKLVLEEFDIKKQLNEVAKTYSESKATTNAGVFLRFLARFITVDDVIKLFAYKLK